MLYLDKFELIQIRRVWFEDNCLFEDKFRFILIKFGLDKFDQICMLGWSDEDLGWFISG